MAVAFDTKFEKGGAVSSLSYVSSAGTVAGSIGSNSNRVLIAYLQIGRYGGTATTAAAVTWAGVSMTLIGAKVTQGTNLETWLFGLINPSTGAQTIAATWTGGGQGGVVLGGLSFYNADQTTGWSDNASAGAVSTSSTLTVANVGANDAAACCVSDDNSTSATITAGTQDYSDRVFNGNYTAGHRLGNGTISWTLGSSKDWLEVGVRVIAVASTTTTGWDPVNADMTSFRKPVMIASGVMGGKNLN